MRGATTIVICLLLVVNSLGGCSHKEKRDAPAPEDYFKKLGIEKAEKRISAPDFVLEEPSGKRIHLRDLRGRLVFLNFWATWCVPCREEMPAMETLHREFGAKGLEVLAVNYRESKEEMRKFLDELGLSFTSLLDQQGKVSEQYGAWSLPLSYIIDRNGEFVGKSIGSRDWQSAAGLAFFRGLLAEEP